MISNKWIRFYIGMAIHYSTASKDPSTKVGCVLVDPDTNRPIGWGCNGFAAGHMNDELMIQREEKYKRVIHAEINSIYNSVTSVRGCVAFLTHPPCVTCINHLAQNDIRTVYYVQPRGEFAERWCEEETKQEAAFCQVLLYPVNIDESDFFRECFIQQTKLKG